jgi:hypothetical protein
VTDLKNLDKRPDVEPPDSERLSARREDEHHAEGEDEGRQSELVEQVKHPAPQRRGHDHLGAGGCRLMKEGRGRY